MQDPDGNGGAHPKRGGRGRRSRPRQACTGGGATSAFNVEATAGGGAASASSVAEGAVGRRAGAGPCTSRSHPVVEGHGLRAQQASSAQATGNHVMEFILDLPFLPDLNSQLVQHYLSVLSQTLRGPVHLDFGISGRDLRIKMQCADAHLLRVSAPTLFMQVADLVQTMPHFVTPAFLRPSPGKRA